MRRKGYPTALAHPLAGRTSRSTAIATWRERLCRRLEVRDQGLANVSQAQNFPWLAQHNATMAQMPVHQLDGLRQSVDLVRLWLERSRRSVYQICIPCPAEKRPRH